MNKIKLLIGLVFMSLKLGAQEATGTWYGLLEVRGVSLRLTFHINKTKSGWEATMDSPDQGANGIKATSCWVSADSIKIEIASAKIEYMGEWSDSTITGIFKQGAWSNSMNLFRHPVAKKERPQEPKKPYPYHSEEVSFSNETAKIQLAGTLTLPQEKGKFPAVVLISGSGPQNRDEELLGHKPFLVISDFLTRNGFAVLRYDDRGTASSQGDFKNATSEDFAADAEAAVQFLLSRKEIDHKKIGLIGHSEGGMIAPMVAAKSKNVAFIVLLAGPGIPIDSLMLIQQSLIEKAEGMSDEDLLKTRKSNRGAFQLVKNAQSTEQLEKDLITYVQVLTEQNSEDIPEGMSKEDFIRYQVNSLANPWMYFFLRYEPATVLKQVKCPVLALNGEKDMQVTAKENLSAISQALKEGGNANYQVQELSNLNHLFQTCKTGAPKEYSEIEETFSPVAMDVMLQWLQTQLK